MSLWQKWAYLAGYIIYFAVGYNLTGRFHLFTPRVLLSTAVDQAIPFLPWTVWFYLSEYLFFFVAVAVVDNLRLLKKMALSFFLCFTVTFFIFIFFPTTFPRDQFAAVESLHQRALMILWQLDAPFNCFPSLHVALVFLVVFSLAGVKKGWAFFLSFWALAISVSTMTIKQHYFIDVVAGVAIASLIVPLSEWIVQYRDSRQGILKLSGSHPEL